jgi:hypothetical protein
MARRLVNYEISSDYVVNSSLTIAGLSLHHEQLLKHSTIVLWFAITLSCLTAGGLILFISLALTDPTGTSAGLLTLILRFGFPALFSSGLFWFYYRIQRLAMEVARQLSRERKLDSARLASESIEDSHTRDLVNGRMASDLIKEPEGRSAKIALGFAK